jgi:predicted MFS family arabinose efflux permease
MIPANTIATSVVLPQHRAGFMSLNSAMMSLSSGTSGLISGAIIVQETSSSPLQNYPLVGIVAAMSTLTALLIVRLLKRFDAEKRNESAGS